LIKTFRGSIDSGGQDTIPLSTRHGYIGYRIIKFQVINDAPGTQDREFVTKIYKIEQATIDGSVDFNDTTLVAVNAFTITASQSEPYMESVIFDKEIFNQDVFVTCFDPGAGTRIANYYIEMEQIKLSENENTVATLKDIRANV